MLGHLAKRFLFEAKVLPQYQGCQSITTDTFGGSAVRTKRDLRLNAR
jgi:hypothetical protein